MEVPGMYLISVSVCLTVLYFVYILFFRLTTFFVANRFYLLGSLLFSFVAPTLDLTSASSEFEIFSTHPVATALQSQIGQFIPVEENALPSETITYLSILSVVYFAGVVIGLMRMGHAVIGVLKIRRRPDAFLSGRFKIFRTDLSQPFSFFNLIFLPEGELDPMIVEHEKVHVRQLHSLDLMIVETAAVLLWFNPLMVLYKRSVRAQHEYLADASTIRNPSLIQHYLMLLWHQIQVENTRGAISHFYSKSIKNRILMITKSKTSNSLYSLYLLLIPVACGLLFAFSNKPAGISIAKDDTPSNGVVIVVDPGHGGTDHGAKSRSGLTEKQLTLAIAKKIEALGPEKGLKVILTRGGDETLSLPERTSISEKHKAKLFVSLHINIHSDVSKSGIECIISEGNIAFEQSRMLGDQLIRELGLVKGIGVNGIMKSDFYVLKNNSVPAIALELGYLSNDADQTFISNEKHQKVLAEKIISAVQKHLK